MEIENINFENILGEVLAYLGLDEKTRQEFIQRYNMIVIKRIATQILEELNKKKETDKSIQEVVDSVTDKDDNQMYDLAIKFNKFLTKEEKDEIYMASRISVFNEIIEPLLKDKDEKTQKDIRLILDKDENLSTFYKALESAK